jgi:Mlc titration factor MtfA (ptsG expression regulator)
MSIIVLLIMFVCFMLLLYAAFKASASEKGDPHSFKNFLEALAEYLYTKITGKYIAPFVSNKTSSLTTDEKQYLSKHVVYYRALSAHKKQIFENRVINFMHSIEISGKSDLEITREMELLISASAVQLTFGWRKYYLSMFKRIFVYPSVYYNRNTQNYHKGETSPRGVVVLSWDSFMEGLEITDDNLQLGLHEFAHAVVLQRNLSPEYSDPIFKHWVDKLSKMLENPQVFKAISHHPYFRKYARVNEMEFFAVATEAFFETPADFKNSLPNLYALMCKMYNQNPLRIHEK